MAKQTDQPNTVDHSNDLPLTGKFWLILLAVGMATGIAGGLLMKLLRLVQHIAWGYKTGAFLDAVLATSYAHRTAVLALAGIVALSALWIFSRLKWREANVSRAIWKEQGDVPLGGAVYTGILSIILVGLGAAVGREAAPKEIGAALGSRFSDLAKLSFAQRKLLAACGAGAGMAAIYNVPFGGALFAAEVLLGSLSLANVLPVFAACFIASMASWLLLPPTPTYDVPVYGIHDGLLIFSVLIGPVAGAASALYVWVIGKVRGAKRQGTVKSLLPLIVLAMLGLAACLLPALLGNGKNVVQETIAGNMDWSLLCILLIARPLATALCLRAGIPGGLFTPTLTFGALLGSIAGTAWLAITPFNPADPVGAYAVIGAGAILAAATQGPLSSIALMLELGTNTSALIMPLLIASTGATIVSRALHAHSIYSAGRESVSHSVMATASKSYLH